MRFALSAPPRPRNVRIHGVRTSMRLEAPFWDGLVEIAERLGISVDTLCERIADSEHRGNLSSAIRIFVLTKSRRKPRRKTKLN